MKWDEIHDQSRVVVDKAIENLLAEGQPSFHYRNCRGTQAL